MKNVAGFKHRFVQCFGHLSGRVMRDTCHQNYLMLQEKRRNGDQTPVRNSDFGNEAADSQAIQ